MAYVIFNLTAAEIDESPSGKFTVTNVTDISSLPNVSGSTYFGYDEEVPINVTGFSYGYGYGPGGNSDVVINYTIVYTTHTVGTFYSKLSVNSTRHTYVSGASSTFTVSAVPSPPGPSENTAPTADAGGPYTGYVNSAVTFDGSGSSDPDSGDSIAGYRWDWTNDGTYDTSWLTSATTTHTYTSAGTYTVKLQVKDESAATHTDTATVTISKRPESSNDTMDNISEEYGVDLDEPFNATDEDGDGRVDTLNDPNSVLFQVGNDSVNISGNASILISIGDDNIPEFFWDTEADTITSITHTPGTISDEEINHENETITITVSINKEESQWLYLDIADNYPDYAVTIKTSDGRTISSDMIWRENGKIYVLDDPDTEYLLIYSYVILAPIFDPLSGTTINASKPTITITYKEAISEISSVTFTLEGTDIPYDLDTLDNIIYTITPKTNLTVSGTLQLSLTVKDSDNNTLTSSATYTIELPGVVTPPSEEEDGIPWLIIAGIIILLIILFIVYLFKIGYLYVEYGEHEKGEKTEFDKIDEKKTTTTSKKESYEKGKTKKKK